MLVELWRRRSVSIKQEHSSEAAVCFSEDATDQAVADGVGLQQVAAESYGRFVVASMLFAHIAPVAADVLAEGSGSSISCRIRATTRLEKVRPPKGNRGSRVTKADVGIRRSSAVSEPALQQGKSLRGRTWPQYQ